MNLKSLLLWYCEHNKIPKMIIAGNWKMNLNRDEAIKLVKAIISEEIDKDIDVKMAVPALYLDSLREIVAGKINVNIGAQNIHEASSGAFTGEISAKMVKSCGIEWTILGHSERRKLFGETSEIVQNKCISALGEGLNVVICVGEPETVRNNGNHELYVKNQLLDSLPHELNLSDTSKITIAYEPVWAIGTGLTASPEQAQSMHSFIRKQLELRFPSKGLDIPILYGGSMKPGNAFDLLSQNDIDGGLIGGASLQADSFVQIIRRAEEIKK